MNSKKAKALKKVFLEALKLKGITNYKAIWNMHGQVVEPSLWRQFKKQYQNGQIIV